MTAVHGRSNALESVMQLKIFFLVAAALGATIASGVSASASGRHYQHPHIAHRHNFSHDEYQIADRYDSLRHQRQIAYRSDSSRGVADARPSAWCGWEMRRLVGGNPGPEYNLARNWAHWGRPAGGPAPGVVGVMPHHVFKVVQVLGQGTVLAISGNDGNAVRVRPRSTAGVIAWRTE
jgi:hypothetical protein